ncbi:hypothetical protein BCR33DRAFT_769858 [Rhizoclosmatium globosum]|uniref:Uncharacterized protein n=1 Tax=Rhizoclosmatium globosum TaxID=329046 RepID=A0A1Y2BSV5_9FUNG|nr:hypothetical protein BCR33DRAFT_769858 [Rhizoclosmatium globosum]|eukprot:ORY37205.1 hypothetical protein BCR33DRAFT_769858 [Rhizoclosmatium globosum]
MKAIHFPKEDTISKPKSVAEVEAAMTEMDRIYSTTFKSWITSEANIGYISVHKRDLFDRYLSEDPFVLSLVLQWMTNGWNTASICELLLKLFYSYKIDSRKFTHLLAAVGKNWDFDRKCNVANSLLIGETPQTTAKFIKHFTEGNNLIDESMKDAQLKEWGKEEIVELTRYIGHCMRWNDVFMMDFIIEYTSLLFTDNIQKAAMIASILKEFESLADRIIPEEIPIPMTRTSSDSTMFEPSSDSDADSQPQEPTSEDEAIRREVFAIRNRSSSKFGTQREAIAFGMKVFGRVLLEAEVEARIETAADRLILGMSLNHVNVFERVDSKWDFDSDVVGSRGKDVMEE